MLFKKMLAVLSAITVIGTCSVSNGTLFSVSAGNEIVSDADSETCSVAVSMSSLSDPIPESAHIKARLVKVGEENVDIDEWEITQDGIKELKGLEFSEDFSYKIIISDQPEDYTLPESTTVMLNKEGDNDNIIFCGRSAERAELEESGIYECIEVAATAYYYGEFVFMTDLFQGGMDEKYIVDENGVRYCGLGGIKLPDGHYTAYVIPRNNYRFIQSNSEAAAAIIGFESKFDRRINTDYFDRDFSKGFEFDVVNGETDTLLNFYCEPIPNENNACTANISVVDSETGEPLDDILLELTNEGLIEEGYINWNSSDHNPMSFDKLLNLKKPYLVSPVTTSELYYIPQASFSFSSLGQHEEVVIKAKRKTNINESKIELPDETPVPIDDTHCAVTVGVMDNDRKPAKGVTACIYKKVGSNKTELLSWNAEEEPVKTINDIEYDEDAKYYLAISGESNDYYRYSDMQLAFSKGGSADKVVQLIFPVSMKSVQLQRSTNYAYSYGATGSSNQGWSGIRVTDMQGYRYPCIPDKICLPDGEYLLKTSLNSNCRIVKPNTEMECILIALDPSLKDYFAQNVESYNKGAKFTVKNGICNDIIKFYAEDVPSFRNACTADVSVVDAKTGETVEGVTVLMYSPYNNGDISWNTSDTPVMHFDYLRFLDETYSFKLINIPDGYTYDKPMFSFAKYGEHKDLVIKLRKAPEKGDANCDGQLDLADAILIMQALANPNKYGVNGTDPKHITSKGWSDADTDGDGLTVDDALRIQQYLLGLIDSFD